MCCVFCCVRVCAIRFINWPIGHARSQLMRFGLRRETPLTCSPVNSGVELHCSNFIEMKPPHGRFNTKNSSLFKSKTWRTRHKVSPISWRKHLLNASQQAICFTSRRGWLSPSPRIPIWTMFACTFLCQINHKYNTSARAKY
jgi:hypothetical protein